MFRKTIKYKNFNDEERQKDFWFHLNKSELLELLGSGGIEERLNRMVATKDVVAIMHQMRDIVNMAIGVRSEDGETFIKNDEVRAQLMFSPAYDELLFELMTSADVASEFIKNLMPKDMRDKLEAEFKKNASDPFKEPENPKHIENSGTTSEGGLGEMMLGAVEKFEDMRAAYILENRAPTQEEIQAMSMEEVMQMHLHLREKKN